MTSVWGKRIENLRSKGNNSPPPPLVFSEFLVGAIKVFSIALPACRFVSGWHSARAEAPLEAGTSPVAFVCIQLLAGSAGEEGGGTAKLGGRSDGSLFPGAPSYSREILVSASLSCNCGLYWCLRNAVLVTVLFCHGSGRRNQGLGPIFLLKFYRSFRLMSFGCWAFPPTN